MTCALCSVPVHTQFATPELVGAIVEGGLDPAEDPAGPVRGPVRPPSTRAGQAICAV
ncbi:hypothetical protein SGL43_04867 [Streptomyces globisporus]|uniref:Uncharacterized protein n=1 Tax=Streptomyces globisporus TaxID=1908 RepID=A0ABM9H2J5_STRGL|nr:hypothetical protein GCM10010264_25650 [Streptomyces globisporus]CAH9417820.1 hypothetical protein SGL43_04867 [Streptomyces globisporus]